MYSERFDHALAFASQIHCGQRRKGGARAPYITHLMAVASIVGDAGGSEDQVIAALLHDAIEDCIGHMPNIQTLIRDQYGDDVLAMVLCCTDAWTDPKPPWIGRKEAHLTKLRALPADDPAFLVYLADKLHNVTSILAESITEGVDVFKKFNGGHDGTLCYYRSLATIFADKLGDPGPFGIVRRYQRQVEALEAL